jgi:1-acyl-sn-glycerol-3-phosphate acyltransferase
MLPLQTLTHINTDDLLVSLGLDQAPARRLWKAACHLPAKRFARQVLEYDGLVGERGLAQAARETLNGFVDRLVVENQQLVPQSGPVLFLSNHPGMTDTLALFSGLQRADLQVVAAERPFLKALPNTVRHLIFVRESTQERMGVVRAAVRHLRSGGALLTFPAGQIEPDPAVMPGALESLQNWSDSAALFARLVPETVIVPVLVSGVIWERALRHPLARLRRGQAERERMAATLQLLAQSLLRVKPVTVKVQFGEPLQARLLSGSGAVEIMQAVRNEMRLLIQIAGMHQPELELGSGKAGEKVGRTTNVPLKGTES